MKPRELAKEIAYPVTDLTVLLGIAGFTLLSALAGAAGMLGIWLGILLLPALFRYLLAILEARANGRAAPVAGGEMFDFMDNFWTLTPLILYAASIWGSFLLAERGLITAARLAGLGLFLVLPASLAVLAITRSPLESLNPVAWGRMVRACGRDYPIAAITPPLAALLVSVLPLQAMPGVVANLFVFYPVFLLCTLTGAILNANGVTFQLEIPAPLEPGEAAVSAGVDAERRGILNHAYGFVSRGNLDGGLAHVRSAVRDDPDPPEAWRWYFERMLEWESNKGALFFAQSYLGWLLAEGREPEALKLLTRCFREDSAFRPLAADRERAVDMVRRFRRDDLLENLLEGTLAGRT